MRCGMVSFGICRSSVHLALPATDFPLKFIQRGSHSQRWLAARVVKRDQSLNFSGHKQRAVPCADRSR